MLLVGGLTDIREQKSTTSTIEKDDDLKPIKKNRDMMNDRKEKWQHTPAKVFGVRVDFDLSSPKSIILLELSIRMEKVRA